LKQVIYSTAVVLKLNLATQIRLTPPTVLPKLIYVRVSSITHHVVWLRGSAFTPGAIFTPGEWDLNAAEIIPRVSDPGSSFRTMYEMFVDHMPVEETAEYADLSSRIRNMGPDDDFRLRTIDELVEHLEGYKQIFEDMKENGYKTQKEQGRSSWNDEIWVCVDRNGNLVYYGGGSHRLAMVRILGIEYIPVGVRHIHPLWTEHCFNEYKGQHRDGVLGAVKMWLDDIDCRQDAHHRVA